MISLFGSAIQRFCMSLYVLDLTGSPGIFATILSISMLPYVLLAPVAGNITDYFSKKKIMVCTDIFSCKYYIFTGGDSLHPSVCFSKTALPGQWHCTADRIRCQFCRTCHCGDAVWFSGDPLDRGFKCNQLLCLSADGRISASAGKKERLQKQALFFGQCERNVSRVFVLKKISIYHIKDYFLLRSVQPVHCSGFLRSCTAFYKKCAGSFFRSLWICGRDHSAWDDHGGSTDQCVSQAFFHGCDPQSAFPWPVQCDFIDLHAAGSPRIYDRKDQCIFNGSGDSHDTSRTVFVRTDIRIRDFGSCAVSFCISGKPWDCIFCETGNKKELRNFKKVLAYCI